MTLKQISQWVATATLLTLPSAGFALTSADFTLLGGVAASDKMGRSVASGDFNGDGYADLVTGAPNNPTGYVAIVYGTSSLPTAATLSTSNSVIITGNGSSDFFGVTVATGDVNGDGYADLAVSATGDTTGGSANSGAVYLIYGQASQWTSGAASSLGAKFFSGPGFITGVALAIGNINGDAYDDLLIGSSNDATTGGSASLVYGQSTSYSGSSSITALPKFTGEAAGDRFGKALDFGDINADGYDDAVIGAPVNNDGGTAAGSAYIFYGQSASYSGSTAASTVSEVYGEAAGDNAGNAVALGDITGDGYADIVLAATSNDDGAVDAGAVYVVAGSSTVHTSADTSSLNNTGFTQYTGVTAGDGIGMLAIDDLNGDEVNDIIIGASSVSSSAGAVYLVGGNTDAGSLSAVATITDPNTEAFGVSVGSGDLNDDGFSELLIGANTYNSDAGAVYVGAFLVDADADGMAGSGLLYTLDPTTAVDCSDTDATVTADQTYYIDDDGDGEGVDTTTTTACSTVAPDGYTDNTTDTNDTIPSGTNLVSVVGAPEGAITVTDQTGEHTYTIYNSSANGDTKVKQYQTTGYGIVLHHKGKKVYLVNLYTGEIVDKVSIKKSGFDQAAMILKDLRGNHKDEVIVTAQKRAKVTLLIIKVSAAAGTLSKSDSAVVTNKHIKVTKTKATSKKIQLRSSESKVLETFTVNKKYQLTQNN